MQLQFEHEYLKELYYTKESTDKKHRFQPAVVAGYVKSLEKLESATTISELYWYSSLHFEPLKGNKRGLYSVRANDKYRVEFTIQHAYDQHGRIAGAQVLICNIVDLTNHYKR